MTQPEALLLAEALDELDAQFSYPGTCGEAAAELRRLHAQRDALLEALKEIYDWLQPDETKWAIKARAAIAKAEES